MPDVYKRRFAIKGTKKDVMKALRFMAEQAALKTEYSYLYEMFLKPTEVGKAGEPYGLTENFDQAGEMDQVGFFSCGYMVRRWLAVLEYETVFREISADNPDIELYAEIHNEGGIQETQPYMESFYSPAGSAKLTQRYIQIYQDPHSEEYDPSKEPPLSAEDIEAQYLETWGKPKSYFESLLRGGEAGESNRKRDDFYYLDVCKEMMKGEIKVSGLDTDEIKERFEHIQTGQKLLLKQSENDDVMLFSEDGRIGTLSGKGNFGLMTFVHDTGELLYFGDAVQVLHHMLQLMPNSIWCKVLDVTPLSKRRKNAKYALLSVELKISQELQKRIEQEQNAGAGFLEEILSSIKTLKKFQ